jgi:hypothetical protein
MVSGGVVRISRAERADVAGAAVTRSAGATDGDSVVSEDSEDVVRPPAAEVATVLAASARADREVGAEVIGTADRISRAERAEVAGAAATPFSMPRDFTGVPPVDDARARAAEVAIVVAASGAADRVADAEVRGSVDRAA